MSYKYTLYYQHHTSKSLLYLHPVPKQSNITFRIRFNKCRWAVYQKAPVQHKHLNYLPAVLPRQSIISHL